MFVFGERIAVLCLLLLCWQCVLKARYGLRGICNFSVCSYYGGMKGRIGLENYIQ